MMQLQRLKEDPVVKHAHNVSDEASHHTAPNAVFDPEHMGCMYASQGLCEHRPEG